MTSAVSGSGFDYFFRWRVCSVLTVILCTLSGISQTVVRGPYLQSGTPSSMVVRWRTDLPCDSQVRYGTNLANLQLLEGDAAAGTEHEVKIPSLQPDTRYFYAIGTSSNILAGSNSSHFFVTSPLTGIAKPTRIWVIGDAGTTDPGQIAVRDAYETLGANRAAELWLMLGDNAYQTGTDAEYQAAVFNIYTNELRQSVLWPTLGNHDTGGSPEFTNTYPYFDMFTLPQNGEAGGVASGTEHYYSFDYGNLHFICLDSMTASRATNGAMAMWLTNDLANVMADWTIAFWHHPPYSKANHDSDGELPLIEMRETFLPILEQGGVDLVLCGHSHSYERSFLLDRHYGRSDSISATNKVQGSSGQPQSGEAYLKPPMSPTAHQGAVYAVVGNSGHLSGGPLNHPAMYISLNNLGSLVLDVNSNRLDARFIRENSNTNDSFTIFKGTNTAPVATPLFASMPGDISTNLTLTGGDADGDAITFAITSPPAHGQLSNFDKLTGNFTYIPAHGFAGTDSFTFHTIDGLTVSSNVTASIQVLSLVDANANGLPDAWETLYALSDPDADPDHDGANNRQEYMANTNPTNAASVLRILSASRNGNGQFVMTWSSVGATRYRVSFCDSGPGGELAGPFLDVTLSAELEMDSAPLGSDASRSFTDDSVNTGGAPAHGTRFYRVQVVQ